MTEHEEQADKLEREAEGMAEDSDRVGQRIDDARRDWEAKEQDPGVPGAKPDPDDEAQSSDEDEGEDEE
jgi:hypothetical protein